MNAELDAAVLARDGTVAVYADEGGDLTLPVRPLMVHNARCSSCWSTPCRAAAKDQAVADVGAAVAAGALRVGTDAGLPLHRFPLDGPPRPTTPWRPTPSARCSLPSVDRGRAAGRGRRFTRAGGSRGPDRVVAGAEMAVAVARTWQEVARNCRPAGGVGRFAWLARPPCPVVSHCHWHHRCHDRSPNHGVDWR